MLILVSHYQKLRQELKIHSARRGRGGGGGGGGVGLVVAKMYLKNG